MHFFVFILFQHFVFNQVMHVGTIVLNRRRKDNDEKQNFSKVFHDFKIINFLFQIILRNSYIKKT